MRKVYIVCDGNGSVRIEPAAWGDDAYVQTYENAEAAGRAADMLNNEFNGFLLVDGELTKARPWTVWELSPVEET